MKRNQNDTQHGDTNTNEITSTELGVNNNSESNCQMEEYGNPISNTSNKNKGKKSKHPQKMKKDQIKNDDATIKKTTCYGLASNIESDCQNDIEKANSSLGAESLVPKGNVNV